MKYILFEKADALPVPLFLLLLTHRELAEAMAAKGWRPASAGFCKIAGDGTVTTYGESTSLGLRPATHDAAFLTAMLRASERAA